MRLGDSGREESYQPVEELHGGPSDVVDEFEDVDELQPVELEYDELEYDDELEDVELLPSQPRVCPLSGGAPGKPAAPAPGIWSEGSVNPGTPPGPGSDGFPKPGALPAGPWTDGTPGAPPPGI